MSIKATPVTTPIFYDVVSNQVNNIDAKINIRDMKITSYALDKGLSKKRDYVFEDHGAHIKRVNHGRYNLLKKLAAKHFYVTLPLFFLVSCVTSFPNTNVDPNKNNPATYNQDLKDCKEAYPEAGSGVHIKQWISCMNLKGWK
jgi:hypothetical protein